MRSETFTVRTGGAFAAVDLTERVQRIVEGTGDGLCNVFVPHATAGVAVFETGAGTEADVERALADLLPREEGRWAHRHGSPGHGADHVLPLIVAPSITVPVVGGRLALGTWQSIVLVDPNVDNAERTVRVSLLGG
jgi:secondary thiamine-phosphate synthase enzyme